MNKENASRNGKKVKDSIDILKNVGNQGEGSISNDVGVLIWVNRLLLIMVNKEILQNKHFFFFPESILKTVNTLLYKVSS